MGIEDPAAIDRLNRLLDAGAGAPPRPTGAENIPVEWTSTLRQLHALDATLGPEPGLDRRIWQGLMTDRAFERASPSGATTGAGSSANGHAPAVALPPLSPLGGQSRRWSPVAELATAAILLLTLLGGYASFRIGDRSGGDDRAATFGGFAATPLPTSTSLPGTCAIAPRSLDSIRRINDRARGDATPQPFGWRLVPLPAGPPADVATVAAIDATLRELTACEIDGEPMRAVALFTDAYFARSFATSRPVSTNELLAVATPNPDEAGTGFTLVAGATGVQLLPDGRVGALVAPWTSSAFTWDPEAGFMLVFIRVSDRYLIDDQLITTLEDLESALALATARAAPTSETIVDSVPTVATSPADAIIQPTVLPATGSVEVTVVDPADATIAVSPDACFILTGTIELPPVCDNEEANSPGLPADADPTAGIVRIDDMPPGSYDVQLRSAPRGYTVGPNGNPASADVVVAAGLRSTVLIISPPVPPIEPIPSAAPVPSMEAVAVPSPTPPAANLATALATAEEETTAARATVAALSTQAANTASSLAAATALAADARAHQLDPNPVTHRIRVDADAVLAGDPAAVDAALAELRRVLDRYAGANCRVGFAQVSADADDVPQGIALADSVANLLRRDFPDLFDGAAIDAIAETAAQPRGEVTLQLFFVAGCAPAASR